MFHRRSGTGGPHLRWRMVLLGLGALLALLGMGLDRDWMVNAALGILVLGFGLRFLPGGEDGEEGDRREG